MTDEGMPIPSDIESRRDRLAVFNARLRGCRRCHEAGFLDAPESIPVAFDAEPDAPVPKILLIGQAPGIRGPRIARPFDGPSGEKLRSWFEAGGIPREDFWRKIHFGAVTRCYPGRLPGARGDRLPTPAERALCRAWLDELVTLIEPEIILLLGLLAIRTALGPVPSLSSVVGTARIIGGVRYLPLPHPSGVSRWHNDPANTEAVGRAMLHLREWVHDLNL
ncbi:uracil-DNA glycosylase family protein [Tundrisphaera lichenicola]|uniref:uracil-DNA glycosylase family protein n=1 Tax=Tundrisphaera lichenicola TaxID=2029860 RepID=UPI003EC0254E